MQLNELKHDKNNQKKNKYSKKGYESCSNNNKKK